MIVLSKLLLKFYTMLINRYFNIKKIIWHRTSFHVFPACYVEILVFGTLWRSAVEIGLFRMINFVENDPIKMCRTILCHWVRYALLCHRIRRQIKSKVNSNRSYGTILQIGNTFPWFPANIRKQVMSNLQAGCQCKSRLTNLRKLTMADIQIITKTDYGYLQKQATLAYSENNFQETIQQQGPIEGGGMIYAKSWQKKTSNSAISCYLCCKKISDTGWNVSSFLMNLMTDVV